MQCEPMVIGCNNHLLMLSISRMHAENIENNNNI